MITNLTKQDLIDFEEDIANTFNQGKIRAPIHLDVGNEDDLLEVFEEIQPEDWVFCTWRSHIKCLLKGVPPDVVKAEILDGKSIGLCFPSHHVYSSAIVAGAIPIALGAAFDLKRKGDPGKVWCFVGDMGAQHGAFHEALMYAENFDLPLHFVVEDNGKSVCTDTRESWGSSEHSITRSEAISMMSDRVTYYKYDLGVPHAGTNAGRVQF